MTAHGINEDIAPACRCDRDTDLELLHSLLADGVDQLTASRMVWGGEFDMRVWVRRQYLARFPWLRIWGTT